MALTFIQLFRSKSQVSLVTLSLLYTLELNNHQFLLRYLLNISWINFLSSSPVISSIIKTNRLSPELHLWSPMWCLCPISTSPSLETYSLLGWYVWNVNEFLTPLLTSFQWFTNGLRKKPIIFHRTYTDLVLTSVSIHLSLAMKEPVFSLSSIPCNLNCNFPKEAFLEFFSSTPSGCVLTNWDKWIFIVTPDGLYLQLFDDF